MVMRVLFLCFASWLVSMTQPLFTIDAIQIGGHPLAMSVRDVVMFAGGLYLLYKGISELVSLMSLEEEKAKEAGVEDRHARTIGLPRAVLTIMVMDIVFSIDSVITAVGMANHLIVMILAVTIRHRDDGVHRLRPISSTATPSSRSSRLSSSPPSACCWCSTACISPRASSFWTCTWRS